MISFADNGMKYKLPERQKHEGCKYVQNASCLFDNNYVDYSKWSIVLWPYKLSQSKLTRSQFWPIFMNAILIFWNEQSHSKMSENCDSLEFIID